MNYNTLKMPSLNKLCIILFAMQTFLAPLQREPITRLKTSKKIVALTFDACEARESAYFDERVLSVIIQNKIPCTIFVSGKFAERNVLRLKELSKYPFIEIENHSYHHYQHSGKLNKDQFLFEINETNKVIESITGRKPKFFRFPAGNYSLTKIAEVKSCGMKTVHWTFPSGDPDPKLTAGRIQDWVLGKTRPGSILIFHINGKGKQTPFVLEKVVNALKGKGYEFDKLENCID